jgi:TonB family protein
VSLALLALAAAVMRPVPIGNPADWINPDDYPAASIAADEEGIVVTLLQVNSDGTVSSCRIATSSGHPALDTQTCKLLAERARFTPAHDKTGRAQSDFVRQQVRWSFSHDKLTTQGVRVTFAVNDGRLGACRYEKVGYEDLDLKCDPQGVAELFPAMLAKPLTAWSEVALTVSMQVEDESRIALVAPDGVERKVVMQGRLTVAPNGVVTACNPLAVTSYKDREGDFCAISDIVGKREFDADPEGRTRIFTVTVEVSGNPR